MGRVKWTFILSVLLQLLCIAEGCIELDAGSSTDSFVSHDTYPLLDYTNGYSECWIITASSGKKVKAWSDDNIELEDCFDPLDVYCGDSSSDELYETYCNGDIVDVVSYENELRFEFTTDSFGGTATGFRIKYKQVSSSTSSTCFGSSPVAAGLAVGIIVAIVICSLIAVAVVVAIVVCCIINNNKHRGRVNATHGPVVTTVGGTAIITQPVRPPGYSTAPYQPPPPGYNAQPGGQQTSFNALPPGYSRAQNLPPAGGYMPPPATSVPQGQYPPPPPFGAGQDPVYPPPSAVYPPPPPNPY